MSNHVGRFALIAFLLAGYATPTTAATVRVYHVEPLPFLPGGSYMIPIAINANGDVAGSGIAADGRIHAYRWSATSGLEDLGRYGVSSMAWGMNDNGDVVGTSWDADFPHPFIAPRGGVVTDLMARYPQILQINDISNDGRMTGFTWQWHAFRTQPDGTFQELTSNFSFGARINSSGQVAGVIWGDAAMTEPRHAFRYTESDGLVDLGTLHGGWSGATAINSSAVVAGWSGGGPENVPTRAFRLKPGEPMQDLGVLPWGFMGGAPAAYAINAAGDVVGATDGWLSWTPFLYTDADGMIDLRFHVTTADRLTVSIDSACGINSSGQIVASGAIGYGYGTARLTPFEREFGGPVASPTVDNPVLSPPDNRMVMVSVDPHVTDEFDPEPVCRITHVVNSEGPAEGPDPDVSIDYFLSVQLRATRLGSGPGRTYTLELSCSDKLGVTSVTDVVVTVPHDRGQSQP